jgi:putative SOS response-associated peptidase YedK
MRWRRRVILEPDQFEPWLAGKAGVELLQSAANDVLQKWPVSKRVNKIGNDDDATLLDRVLLS